MRALNPGHIYDISGQRGRAVPELVGRERATTGGRPYGMKPKKPVFPVRAFLCRGGPLWLPFLK